MWPLWRPSTDRSEDSRAGLNGNGFLSVRQRLGRAEQRGRELWREPQQQRGAMGSHRRTSTRPPREAKGSLLRAAEETTLAYCTWRAARRTAGFLAATPLSNPSTKKKGLPWFSLRRGTRRTSSCRFVAGRKGGNGSGTGVLVCGRRVRILASSDAFGNISLDFAVRKAARGSARANDAGDYVLRDVMMRYVSSCALVNNSLRPCCMSTSVRWKGSLDRGNSLTGCVRKNKTVKRYKHTRWKLAPPLQCCVSTLVYGVVSSPFDFPFLRKTSSL
jgi:hypothetical protein